MLETEIDRVQFHTTMDQFVSYWKNKEPDFVKYFTEQYLCRAGNIVYFLFISIRLMVVVRAEKWARCYRHFDHADTDTNMYLER